MEELFNTFSCKSWIILKEEHAHKLVQMLSLQKRKEDLSWEQILEGQDKTPDTLIFTSNAIAYAIVEEKCVRYEVEARVIEFQLASQFLNHVDKGSFGDYLRNFNGNYSNLIQYFLNGKVVPLNYLAS